MTLQEIQDIVARIDAATLPSSVTNIMVARVLQWLLSHLSQIEDIDILPRITNLEELDAEALRIHDTSDNEYPMPGNTMVVLSIDEFNALQRLQDGVLYVVTQATAEITTPQAGENTGTPTPA